MRCLGTSCRCCCDDFCACTCCLSDAERNIRAASDILFDVVNTEANCCGCKDDVLSRTETMLLLSVLHDESRHNLRMHSGLIAAIVAKLREATSGDTDGGSDITRNELRTAVLAATSTYQQQAIAAIAGELARDYEALQVEPLTMDRGMPPGIGGQRLLPS